MFTYNDDLISSGKALIEGEPNTIANLANLTSLVFHTLPNLNWVGFYFWDSEKNELVLGPFQGKPACIRIKPNRGICGKAYTTQKSQLIPDVNQVSDHIACDIETKSELVVPLIVNEKCIGVLDLDSPQLNRFSEEDLKLIESFVHQVVLTCVK